jgi:hypothetical protein
MEQLESEWKTKEQMREEEFKRTEFEYTKLKVQTNPPPLFPLLS